MAQSRAFLAGGTVLLQGVLLARRDRPETSPAIFYKRRALKVLSELQEASVWNAHARLLGPGSWKQSRTFAGERPQNWQLQVRLSQFGFRALR